ncbi:MAG TPA: GTPase ObgE [Caldisericia bacterium]|nr:GTPase ObgE [Caldisericia bacterium]HOL83112.1 GTPase ObgE [Caldisericia bacterium]HPP43237.1 GTPase ObgE [Caldisericia bacterium]
MAEIYCKAGDGGDGIIAFRREKYVPMGGPSGGDGGRGGNIILKVNKNLNTLTKFKYNNIFKAEDGKNGEGDNKKGKDGKDLYIEVPPGILVWDSETKELICDLTEDNEKFVLCKGGRGGRGNSSFKTPTDRAPRIRELGEKGEERRVILELKIIGDGALVGYPNAGKSTILTKISNAKPKIEPYPFTTLTPVIGEVRIDDKKSITIVDMPGIIDGASSGKGLGLEFLRHIQRTYFLIFVIDISIEAESAIKQFESLINEIENYDKEILNKYYFVILNKIDLQTQNMEEIEKYFKDKNIDLIKISALKDINIDKLFEKLKNIDIKRETQKISIPKRYKIEEKKNKELIVRKEGNKFIVENEKLGRLIKGLDLNSRYGVEKLQKISKEFDVEKMLKEKGIKNGDIVVIEGVEFKYYE